MNFESTNLPFLEEDIRNNFDKNVGEKLLKETAERYSELLQEADKATKNFQGSEALRRHYEKTLLPTVAYYDALRANGFGQEEALGYVREETKKRALLNAESNRKLARMPFSYAMYRAGVKKHMQKNFPAEGFGVEWVRNDKSEIHFNMTRCMYRDETQKLGCPELCAVFCESDIIAFGGLAPKILFERAGTLGEGAPLCDFHFKKGTRHG
ncbi:MAG TPA: L-2-amino-thiazoline-4-carboxylic acid hydrolase [Candidatus Borkfalkia excrementipullorum]|nr:L-2-amino-thiazoline-4-carboxylic acid hydrolase [Candidatus Borkfalkia excrementipullorum]